MRRRILKCSALLLFACGVCGASARASARVCLTPDGRVRVSAILVYYGTEAARVASACSSEISRMFNEPRAKVLIDGKPRPVEFDVGYRVASELEAIGSLGANRDPLRNFVRVEQNAMNGSVGGRSNHGVGLNCGYYAASDDLGNSTTCAHEFAHGLGLKHYDERPGGSLRVNGQPGIMAPRGSKVESQYQYDPTAKEGAPGGTLNPYKRKVLAQDIADLGLGSLKYDSTGCASLGSTQDYGHDAQGRKWNDPWLSVTASSRILALIGEQLAPVVSCSVEGSGDRKGK